MKVAITGHSNGIGLGLYQYFQDQGHQVQGFSRSNGYVLPEAVDTILIQSLDCDLFVNNSLPIQSQIELLEKLWEHWKNTDKTIVIVNSIISAMKTVEVPEYMQEYQQQKNNLDALCRQLRFDNAPCKILSIRPGYVATNIFHDLGVENPPKEVCMSVDDVVSVVDYMLNVPIYVHDITFRKK